MVGARRVYRGNAGDHTPSFFFARDLYVITFHHDVESKYLLESKDSITTFLASIFSSIELFQDYLNKRRYD